MLSVPTKIARASCWSSTTVRCCTPTAVLVATGRRPNGDQLDAEQAGIEIDDRRIIVDEYQRPPRVAFSHSAMCRRPMSSSTWPTTKRASCSTTCSATGTTPMRWSPPTTATPRRRVHGSADRQRWAERERSRRKGFRTCRARSKITPTSLRLGDGGHHRHGQTRRGLRDRPAARCAHYGTPGLVDHPAVDSGDELRPDRRSRWRVVSTGFTRRCRRSSRTRCWDCSESHRWVEVRRRWLTTDRDAGCRPTTDDRTRGIAGVVAMPGCSAGTASGHGNLLALALGAADAVVAMRAAEPGAATPISGGINRKHGRPPDPEALQRPPDRRRFAVVRHPGRSTASRRRDPPRPAHFSGSQSSPIASRMAARRLASIKGQVVCERQMTRLNTHPGSPYTKMSIWGIRVGDSGPAAGNGLRHIRQLRLITFFASREPLVINSPQAQFAAGSVFTT